MAGKTTEGLSHRGSQILAILWELGSATAERIRESLPDDLHDSTVRTLLRQLEEKRLVKHTTRGRTFVFAPAVARDSVQSRALTSFLGRFFGGSGAALVQRLLSDEHLTPEELAKIRKGAEQPPRRRKGGRS